MPARGPTLLLDKILLQITAELKVAPRQVNAAVELLDGGATVPFIARYRKEATENLDDIQLRLQIPPESDWEKDPEIGHEDWVIIGCHFSLALYYQASNISLNATGVARFYLEPIGDRWYISVWRDESYL